jgi:uncharacterized protein
MDDLFTRGIAEFNRQYFFEAHDVWEELWNETTGSRRLFYQGLIQTAVGFYHLSNENYKGACSQFGKALKKLERYVPTAQGVNVALFVSRLKECQRDAERLREGSIKKFNQTRIPQIEFE